MINSYGQPKLNALDQLGTPPFKVANQTQGAPKSWRERPTSVYARRVCNINIVRIHLRCSDREGARSGGTQCEKVQRTAGGKSDVWVFFFSHPAKRSLKKHAFLITAIVFQSIVGYPGEPPPQEIVEHNPTF